MSDFLLVCFLFPHAGRLSPTTVSSRCANCTRVGLVLRNRTRLAPEAQLQVAVHALPMAAFPGGSPTRSMLTKASNGLNTDMAALPSPPSALTSKAPSTAWCVHGTLIHHATDFCRIFFDFLRISPEFLQFAREMSVSSGTQQ